MTDSNIENPLDVQTATECSHGHACLSNPNWCQTDLFDDRDVLVVRCREQRRCHYRRKYNDFFICSCPTKTALSFDSI